MEGGEDMNKRQLYLPNGYINMTYVMNNSHGMRVWMIGGRGIGKTYGCLKYALDLGRPFIYMRRTLEQLDDMCRDYFNPFKALRDAGYFVNVEKFGKRAGRFYTGDPEEPEAQQDRGIMLALSGVAALRGFDLSDYDLGIFDEAIPEGHEPQRKGEGIALLNALETINRNREQNGRPTFRMCLLANSNTLDSRILAETGDSDIIQRMQAKGQTYYDTPAVTVWLLNDSPISEWKRGQALYAGQTGRFVSMALNNEFANDMSGVKQADLRQYKARAVLGDLVLWRSRHGSGYHVTTTSAAPAGSLNGVRTYYDDERGRKECRIAMPFLALAYTQQRITFAEYSLRFRFQDFIY